MTAREPRHCPPPLRGGWNASESMAGLRRNHRLEWIGIAGCFASEYAPCALWLAVDDVETNQTAAEQGKHLQAST